MIYCHDTSVTSFFCQNKVLCMDLKTSYANDEWAGLSEFAGVFGKELCLGAVSLPCATTISDACEGDDVLIGLPKKPML